MKSGTLTVKGGTINGTGDKKDYEYYGNGGKSTGDALVIDNCNYPNGTPVPVIKGGTFNSSNNKGVASYYGNTATVPVKNFITGGTFIGAMGGGVTNDLCGEGYAPNTDGTGVVVASEAKVGTTLYTTFAAAAAEANGQVITLLASPADEYTMAVGQTIKVQKAGFNITMKAPEGKYAVKTSTSSGVTTFTIVDAVASITKGNPAVTTYYNTLSDAYSKAATGDEVVVEADISADVAQSVVSTTTNKTVTLNLNGHTVENKGGGNVLYVSGSSGKIPEMNIVGTGTLTATGTAIKVGACANVTVGENVTINGNRGIEVAGGQTTLTTEGTINGTEAGIFITGAGTSYENKILNVTGGSISGQYGIYSYQASTVNISAGTVTGISAGTGTGTAAIALNGYYVPTWSESQNEKEKILVNVTGGTIQGTGKDCWAIAGSGNENDGNYEMNLSGGTITAEGCAIYHCNDGVVNVSGTVSITGATAIYQKSGTLNISGGTINGNGAEAEYSYNGNGANATGDGIVIDNCGYPGGAPTVSITGGNINSANTQPVGSYVGNTVTEADKVVGFISGGTFSSAVPEEYCSEGYIPTGVDTETGMYTVKSGSYVASITVGETTTKYETLEAAFAAATDGQTITVLSDCAGNGIKVPQGKFTNGLTVDFNGHKYTMDGTLVGSTGTETQAFQLLKNNNITFKNGTIYSEKAKLLVQNYSNLTLDNMTLTLNNSSYTNGYTLSNNNGNTVINNSTINANPAGKFAFDVCRYASYPSVSITVSGNSTINGDVEVSASNNDAKDGFSLNLESGTLTGKIVLDPSAEAAMESTPDKVSIEKKNTFTEEAPEGYIWVAKDDNSQTLAKAVAQIGTVGYASLKDAIEAVTDGQTITLLDNVTLDANATSQLTAGESFQLELGNYTVTNTVGDNTYSVQLEKGAMAKTSTAADIFSIKDNVTDATIVSGLTHAETGHYAYYAATTTKQVAYVNEQGAATTTPEDRPVVVIDNNMDEMIGLDQDGWFVVNDDVELSNLKAIGSGEVNLILADGKTLTHSNDNGLIVKQLTVYGQSEQSGKMTLTSTLGKNDSNAKITINGGIVIVNSGDGGTAMNAGEIKVNAGQVEAHGAHGMVEITGSTIILGLSNDPDDYIIADSYEGTVKIADGQTLYDSDDSYTPYTGTLTDAQKAAIAGHKLVKSYKYAAQIFDSNNVEIGKYETLKEAFNAVQDGQTIKLLKKINLNSGGLGSADNNNFTCPLESGTITIDYNDSTITASNRFIDLHNGIKVITNKVYTNDSSRPTYFRNADANSIAVAGLIDETDKYFQVTVLAKTADVPYVDEHGADQVAAYSVPLTSDLGTTVFLGTGDANTTTWYHLTDDASFKSLLYTLNNTATIILTDEKTLTVSGGPIQGTNSTKGNLVLYGQKEQTGKLNASWQGNRAICMLTYTQNGGTMNSTGSIDANQITINEGNLTVTGNGGGYAPLGRLNVTSSSFVNINGGVVDIKRTAKTGANGNAIQTYAVNITDGQLTAESTNNAIYAEGNITITGGKTTVKSNEEENNYGMYAGGNITMSLTKNDEYINSINGKYHASSITLPLPGLYAQGTGDHYQGVVPATDINNKKLVLQPYEAVIDFGGDKGEVFYMTLAEADKHDQNGEYIIRLLHNIESPYTMGASPDSIMKINRNGRNLTIAAPRGYFVKAESAYNQTQVIDGQTVNDATITTYTSIPVNTTIATATYNAKPQLPEVDVTDIKNNVKLELDRDFKVVTVNTDGYTDANEYVDAIRIVGIVTPEDTQENGYIADIYSNFTILPLNLTDFVVSATADYVATGYGANNGESGAAVKEAATITIINGNGDAISDELSAVLQITIDNDPTPANNYNNAGLYEDVVHVAPFANADVDYSSNFTGSIAAGNLFIGEGIDISEIGMVESYVKYTGKNQPPSPGRLIVTVKDPATGEKVRLTHNQDYVYAFNGVIETYKDAKTYSHAVTITGIGKYYGSFTADYVISPRELTEKYIVCEAVDPLTWTGGTLKLNVNGQIEGRTDNNVTLKLVNREADPDNNIEEDAYYLTSTHDYTYTTEPVTMKEPGEYVVTFTGRYNFTGKRTVTVMVLKDINLLAADDVEIPVQILGSVTPNIRPSNIQDMVVTDGTNVLELGTHYTLTFTDGVTTYQGGTEGPYITEPGKYTAIITGKQPYYSGEKRKNFAVVNEYYAADATQNEQSVNNNYGVHITSGKDMTATVGAKNGGAAVSSDTKTLTLSKDVVVSTPSPRDTTVTFTLAGIDDNAFAGCNQLSWIDATAMENYTPTTLTREFDGPFGQLPKQSLVFLKGNNITGENYVYKVGEEDFRCDEFKIYDDINGNQKGFKDGDYAWLHMNPHEFTANSIMNTRQMKAGQHYTVCLPYDLPIPSTLKAYTLDASSSTILGFKEVTGTLEAFKPYVVIASGTGNLLSISTGGQVPATTYNGPMGAIALNPQITQNYTFAGTMTYLDGNLAEGKYIMQGDKTWKKIASDSNFDGPCILPMRAYIGSGAIPSGARLTATFTNADGSTTGINDLHLDADNSDVYDIQGRKVDTTKTTIRKGVYIVNGRKVVKK